MFFSVSRFRIVMSFWWIDPLITIKYPSTTLELFLEIISIFSEKLPHTKYTEKWLDDIKQYESCNYGRLFSFTLSVFSRFLQCTIITFIMIKKNMEVTLENTSAGSSFKFLLYISSSRGAVWARAHTAGLPWFDSQEFQFCYSPVNPSLFISSRCSHMELWQKYTNTLTHTFS